MMRTRLAAALPVLLLPALLAPALLRADDRWLQLKSGPFDVLTNSGEKAGRDALNHLEQLRYTLGAVLGKPELKSVWPIVIVLQKPAKNAVSYPVVKLARDSFVAQIAALGPETLGDVTKILLEANAGRLPTGLEYGLVELFSTLDVEGTHVTAGRKPEHPDRDWSRVSMLTVDPAYSGKLRVLLYNLQQGVDADAAYKNAFDKTPDQVDKALNSYIEAGKYETAPLSGRPLDAKRQLLARSADSNIVNLALADALLAHGAPEARAAYEAILRAQADSGAAEEGLGLIALEGGRTPEAKKHLDAAAKNTGAGPRALVELGKLEPDVAKKKAAFQRAAKLNPLWAEPLALQAETETDALRKVPLLKAAAQLEARSAARWQALAHAQENAKQFADAAKSWGAAERATESSAERAAIHQARLAGDQQRLDQEDAARLEARRKTEQELQDLRNKALADIRAFETKANAGQSPRDPNVKIEDYHEAVTVRAKGMLQRVDCIGRRARLHVISEEKGDVQVLVSDPGQVGVMGGGEHAWTCGIQKSPRRVVVDYVEKADKKLGTVGEVATIEFR